MLLDQHANSSCQLNCNVVLLGCCVHNNNIDDYLLIGEKWQNGRMAYGMAEWRMEWQNGRIARMVEWQNGGMAYGMAEWRTG
jgi:hypothetical protein